MKDMKEKLKTFRIPSLFWAVSVFLFIFLCCKPLPAAEMDPRIPAIVEAMEHHKELSSEVQLAGTMLWTTTWSHWSKADSNRALRRDSAPSTREADIFLARSGDRLRYDLTMKFPDKDPETVKHIVEPGKEIMAALLKDNPHVFIKEMQGIRSLSSEVPMLFDSHYSLAFTPLSEILQGEDFTFQVREEIYNGSKCLVLHGEITEVGLERLKPPLPGSHTMDFWLDTEKDLSIVQSKYHFENRDCRERTIELGKYGDYWFPKKIRQKTYGLSEGKKQLVDDVSFEASEVTLGQKADPSLFTLDGLNLPPQTIVVDEISGIKYRLSRPDAGEVK
jgi:hypothetical protein